MQRPRILPVDPDRPAPAAVAAAAEILCAGELAVIPTETVYGLSADPRNPAAMARLFAAKGRDAGKPVALLVAALDHLREAGAEFPPPAERLARRFWPGALTLVLDTPAGPVGFRWPDHAVPAAVIRAFGRPIAATSANPSGAPDACRADEAIASLGAAVALVLDGGPVRGAIPSTVVRVEGDTWRILRSGAISPAEIRAAADPPPPGNR